MSLVQTIGIPNSGYAGFIVALSLTSNIGITVVTLVMASLFAVNTAMEIILLKKVQYIICTICCEMLFTNWLFLGSFHLQN